MLSILDVAPDFKAEGVRGRGERIEVALSRLRGRWVVLFFYPADFSTICPVELRELSQRAPEFAALGAELLALSGDDVATHARWIGEVLGELRLPLLADPGGVIATRYGAWLAGQGVAARATFVVDPGGTIQYAAAHALGVGRSISDLLRIVEALAG
jgi:alkyl hydroperoxide reductase subunit AhpC